MARSVTGRAARAASACLVIGWATAPAVFGGATDFHGNDSLDMSQQDANMLCVTDVSGSTAIDFCGSRNPFGCSCLPKCEFLGDCCSDYADACGATTPTGSAGGTAVAGRDAWKVTIPQKTGARLHHLATAGDGPRRRFVAPLLSGSNLNIAALTGVRMSDLDNRSDEADCQIGSRWNNGAAGGEGSFYAVSARVINASNAHWGSIGVECEGAALVLPATLDLAPEQRVLLTPEERVDTNGKTVIHDGFTFGDSRTHAEARAAGVAEAVLTRFHIQGGSGSFRLACRAEWDAGLGRFVLVREGGQGASECGARVIDGNGVGLTFAGEFESTLKHIIGTEWRPLERSTVTLVPQAGHACFLSEVDFSQGPEWTPLDLLGVVGLPLMLYSGRTLECSIGYRDNDWVLRSNGWAHCRAKCFTYGDAASIWPPDSVAELESHQGIAARSNRYMTGRADTKAHLYSYGTGDGRYDSPGLMAEGADPGNAVDSNYYVRLTPGIFDALLRAGMDIWFIDYARTGHWTMLENARATADLIQQIVDESVARGFDVRTLPTVGGSEGAQRLRAALAAWEEGRFHEQTGMWPVEGIRSATPPVSLFLGANASIDGTHLPPSLLATIYDMGRTSPELGESDLFRAIVSENTKEVLTENLAVDAVTPVPAVGDDACFDANGRDTLGRLWDHCHIKAPGLSFVNFKRAHIFRNQPFQPLDASGLVPFDLCGTPQLQPYPTWAPSATTCTGADCRWLDEVYDRINGNGWPQGPLKVGISQGSWYAQRCDRYPDWVIDKFTDCRADATGPEAYVATLDFKANVFPGHATFDTSECQRQAFLRLENARSRRDGLPGDFTTGLTLEAMEQYVGRPGFIEKLDFKQFHPFMFNETSRSLGCPYFGTDAFGDKVYGVLGAFSPAQQAGEAPLTPSLGQSPDEWCEGENRKASRFDRVHSQQMRNRMGRVYNASHDEFEYENALLVKMYAWDCRADGGDCDGYFGDGSGGGGTEAANPFWLEAKAYVDDPGAGASAAFSQVVNERRDCFDAIRQDGMDCTKRVLTFGHDAVPRTSDRIGETFEPSFGCLMPPCPPKSFADIEVTLLYGALDQEIRVPILFEPADSTASMGTSAGSGDGHKEPTYATGQGFELVLGPGQITSYPAAMIVHDDTVVDRQQVEHFSFRIGGPITLANGDPAPYELVVDDTPFRVTIVDNEAYDNHPLRVSAEAVANDTLKLDWSASAAFVATGDGVRIACTDGSDCHPVTLDVPGDKSQASLTLRAPLTPCRLQRLRLRGLDPDGGEGGEAAASSAYTEADAMWSDGTCRLLQPTGATVTGQAAAPGTATVAYTVEWDQYQRQPGVYEPPTATYVPSPLLSAGRTQVLVYLEGRSGPPRGTPWGSKPATEMTADHRIRLSGDADVPSCATRVWKLVVRNDSGAWQDSEPVEIPYTRGDGDCAPPAPEGFTLSPVAPGTFVAEWAEAPDFEQVHAYVCQDQPGCAGPLQLWKDIEDPGSPGRSLPIAIPAEHRCATYYVRLWSVDHRGFESAPTDELTYTDPRCALPDLVVASHRLFPPRPRTATPIQFKVVVRNAGDGAAPPSTMSFRVGGESTPEIYSVPALAPGQTHSVARSVSLAAAGRFANTITLDVTGAVKESNEGNNRLVASYTVAR